MKEAVLLANLAGFVVEAVQRQLDMPDQDHLRRIGKNLEPFSSTSSLKFGKLTSLEGYVIHKSLHADVSGDFHATKVIDNSTVGLFVGDGEGHAVTGLMNALPLITGFEVYGSDSGSPRYVMDKLMKVSNTLGLAGTGIYCIFTRIEGVIYLSTTSAGHPPLLFHRKGGGDLGPFPTMKSPARGVPFGTRLQFPVGEAAKGLRPGDVLVIYTDGVSDAFGEKWNAQFSGIEQVVLTSALTTSQDFAEAIMRAAEARMPLRDDATVCVVRVLAERSEM
jgi:serine phosphatase RsbU (regulator of sigma subunit)